MKKYVRAGGDVFVAETSAGSNDSDGRSVLFHGVNLHVAGMGAQEKFGREVEGVLHVPSRMVGCEVKSTKIVVVAVDVRAELDGKAHADEDVDDAVENLSDGVEVALGTFAARKSCV